MKHWIRMADHPGLSVDEVMRAEWIRQLKKNNRKNKRKRRNQR